MDIQENISLKTKTTMRIGGTARYFAELRTREDVEQAFAFATEHVVPLIVLGGGSNSLFANAEIEALVVKVAADDMQAQDDGVCTVQSGKILAVLINELAEQGYDLSALTGIPGTVGGAVVGNAGQGAGGVWLDSFVESVTVFADGVWKVMTKEECEFAYRESVFKHMNAVPLVWDATLRIPSGEPDAIKAEIERLLQRRIETQPHRKTAGSCFKSLPDGTPAWKLIQEAGLRGATEGGIEVSEKHCNFLLNTGDATFENAVAMVKRIQKAVPQIDSVEMRFFDTKGDLVF